MDVDDECNKKIYQISDVEIRMKLRMTIPIIDNSKLIELLRPDLIQLTNELIDTANSETLINYCNQLGVNYRTTYERDHKTRKIFPNLWKNIYRFLSLKDLLFNSILVNREWFNRIMLPESWNHRIIISSDKITDRDLANIKSSWKNTREFSLTDCPLITDKGCNILTSSCPEIKDITLANLPLVTDMGLKTIIRNCPEINSFRIDRCPLVTGAGVSDLVKYAGQKLILLSLQNISLVDNCIQDVVLYATELRLLSLKGCSIITDRGLFFFTKANPKLNFLCLNGCTSIEDLGLKYIIDSCSELHHLYITSCQSITDQGLKYLSNNNSLETLSVCNNPNITDIGVYFLIQNCKQIKNLYFINCQNVTDISLAHVAQHGESIISIFVNKNKDITDKGIRHLCHCPRLVVIGVKGCPNVSENIKKEMKRIDFF